MKYLMLFADKFEDTEALATLDVLQRGGDEVVASSLMETKNIATKCGFITIVNSLIKDEDLSTFDAIIIPGGPASFKIMPELPIVNELIKYFVDNNKLVAAICAAPHLVGKLGYFKDRQYTVHPGFEGPVIGGTYRRDLGVVKDGNFITAKSMFYSIEFGLAIYEFFHGKEATEKLKLSCMGEK